MRIDELLLNAEEPTFSFEFFPPRSEAGEANLENGKTLFYAGGCTSCHAVPEQDDKLRLGGGYPLRSPFGTFYVPNISPHPRDGIGSWTPAQFVRAMRGGVSPDGRHYYPSFPYTSYQRMGAADLRDLFAFMLTLQPVEGRVRDHDLAWHLAEGPQLQAFVGDARVLTDDYAPVDQLLTPYVTR